MMQDGLHIGLAAWINAQRKADGFPVYPALPIVTELANFESIQGVADIAKGFEFSRLVNFIPRQGQVADTFSDSAVLWRVHRDILAQMDHATEPWTSAERASYEAARQVLYTTDASGFPAPSQRLMLYEEMKNAYQDVSQNGGSATEIAQALTNWLILGHKQAIEDAFETISRLYARSSRSQAEREALLLNQDPPGVGFEHYGDREFAPTYFAPISALLRETWMEAKVSFDDLERAVGNTPGTGKWTAYRANRTGEVTFNYAVLQCIRPWYTPTLYQTDDWKLNDTSQVVSKGNGTEGLLPAYVDAVYLVSVKNVTSQQKPPTEPPTKPPMKPPITPFYPHKPPIYRPDLLRVDQSVLSPSVTSAAQLSRGGSRLQAIDAGLSKGVVTKASNTPQTMKNTALAVNHLAVTAQLSHLEAVSTASYLRGDWGQVRALTAADLSRRYTVAQAILEAGRIPVEWTPIPTEETPPSQIYVAGFGCKKVSFAPNPNVNYQW
ncbi:hypothetical protein [Leptolyngbya ohadii]|uniref:hypothetical protein n=1 Tax=Leptolyngbya ohadii TaxID=1962290 RepID=UPI000B59DA60|nr:hypothetical protein [Leptolyngbya ohadii]